MNLNNKLLRQGTILIIIGIIAVTIAYIPFHTEINKCISETAHKIGLWLLLLTTLIMQSILGIIVIIALCLAILTFILFCIINYFKNKIKMPRKDMIKFLLMFKDNKFLSISEIATKSEFQIDITKMYFKELKSHKYFTISENMLIGVNQYSLSQKGIIFLKKNNLLD